MCVADLIEILNMLSEKEETELNSHCSSAACYKDSLYPINIFIMKRKAYL